MSSDTPVKLQRRGIQAQPETLQSLIEDAIRDLPVGPYRPDPSLDLTVHERKALTTGGLDLQNHDLGRRDPLSRTAAEYVALLDACFTVRQVADLLDVTPTRVRQLLTGSPRRLVGVRGRNEWRIPAFQFTRDRIVPGWDEVVPNLNPDLHPVAVFRFATLPNADLVVGADERAVSPLDWLFAGRDPVAVADIAEHL